MLQICVQFKLHINYDVESDSLFIAGNLEDLSRQGLPAPLSVLVRVFPGDGVVATAAAAVRPVQPAADAEMSWLARFTRPRGPTPSNALLAVGNLSLVVMRIRYPENKATYEKYSPAD